MSENNHVYLTDHELASKALEDFVNLNFIQKGLFVRNTPKMANFLAILIRGFSEVDEKYSVITMMSTFLHKAVEDTSQVCNDIQAQLDAFIEGNKLLVEYVSNIPGTEEITSSLTATMEYQTEIFNNIKDGVAQYKTRLDTALEFFRSNQQTGEEWKHMKDFRGAMVFYLQKMETEVTTNLTDTDMSKFMEELLSTVKIEDEKKKGEEDA